MMMVHSLGASTRKEDGMPLRTWMIVLANYLEYYIIHVI